LAERHGVDQLVREHFQRHGANGQFIGFVLYGLTIAAAHLASFLVGDTAGLHAGENAVRPDWPHDEADARNADDAGYVVVL
jgi:hypothetical protein